MARNILRIPYYTDSFWDFDKGLDSEMIQTVEIYMDLENGQLIYSKLERKELDLIDKNIKAKYIIIDKTSYLDLYGFLRKYIHNELHNYGFLEEMNGRSGKMKFIVVPQSNRPILQLIPDVETVVSGRLRRD